MKHLVVSDYGTFLGIDGYWLAVKDPTKNEIRKYPLNRLATISIAKRGISLSSDLVQALSTRGIKLFFLDFRGVPHTALLGESQHGVVAIRKAQVEFSTSSRKTLAIAKQMIVAKIRNQRAVLNYFSKYHQSAELISASEQLLKNSDKARKATSEESLLGLEGASATAYFQALKVSSLFSSSFNKREGRGSREINNILLNLGYAILSSYILSAVVNAGLEPYLGVFHVERPGRMSLVLDIMEEYRAWVVDRAVIKLRHKSEGKDNLSDSLKKQLISEVQTTCNKRYLYHKKKVKLEHIIQRQVYRLGGHFSEVQKYKPYLFKW